MSEQLPKRYYEFGPFRLDTAEGQLWRDDEEIQLTQKSFKVLTLLVENGGHVLDKNELMEKVWPDAFVEENRLADNISTLRKLLGDDPRSPRYIRTVPGRGYRFVADVREMRDETLAIVEHTKAHIVIEEDDSNGPTAASAETAKVTSERLVASSALHTHKTGWWQASRLVPAGVAIALIAAGVIWIRSSRLPERAATLPMMRTIQFTSFTSNEFDPALSPDGKLVAFSRDEGEGQEIYVKQVGAGDPLQLTHTERSRNGDAAWSPDGLLIAFIRSTHDVKANGIFTVPALGGPERKLFSLEKFSTNAGLDWSPDGKHIAFTARPSAQEVYGIYLLSTERLEIRRLTSAPSVSDVDSRMAFSPDGQTLSFVRGAHGPGDVYLVATSGGETRRLTFDNRSVIGQSWTADGTHVVFSSNRAGGSFTLWKIPVTGGTPEPVPLGGENALDPHISRAGNRLVFTKLTSDTNVWRTTLTADPGQPVPGSLLISSSRHDRNPAVSPDGQKIAFESSRTGNQEIWMCDAAGSNPVQLTSFDGPVTVNPHWSPDGRQVAFESRTEGHADLHVVNAEGGSPRRLTLDASNERSPSWSRDGRWIYFASDRSGIYQVWKIPSEGGEAIQVTQNGGYESVESIDGQFLYYTKHRTAGIYRAPVAGGEEIMVLDLPELDSWGDWAITNDGIYFLDRKALPRATIQFFDFAQRRARQAAALDKDPGSHPGLNISADRRWLVYSQCDVCNTDIMLVENFR